jgi:hypothetical protein
MIDATLVSFVSALTALSASITGPFVTLYATRIQIRATVRSANRQRWIDEFQDSIAHLCSEIAIAAQGRDKISRDGRIEIQTESEFLYTFERLIYTANKIRLMINPLEPEYQKLLDLWTACLCGFGQRRHYQARMASSAAWCLRMAPPFAQRLDRRGAANSTDCGIGETELSNCKKCAIPLDSKDRLRGVLWLHDLSQPSKEESHAGRPEHKPFADQKQVRMCVMDTRVDGDRQQRKHYHKCQNGGLINGPIPQRPAGYSINVRLQTDVCTILDASSRIDFGSHPNHSGASQCLRRIAP